VGCIFLYRRIVKARWQLGARRNGGRLKRLSTQTFRLGDIACPLCPGASDVNQLGDSGCVVDLDAETAN
jgi:hypothetical protein